MSAKRRRYTGTLATPIVRPTLPNFEGAFTSKRVRQFSRDCKRRERESERNILRQLAQKMSLLMKHYGIQNDPMALAFALASEHVPGFKIVPQVKTKRGRKKEWDGEKLIALHDIVQSVKGKHQFRDRVALKFLAHNPDYAATWGRPPKHQGSDKQWIETLESRLQESKRYISFIRSLGEDFRSGEKFRKL